MSLARALLDAQPWPPDVRATLERQAHIDETQAATDFANLAIVIGALLVVTFL